MELSHNTPTARLESSFDLLGTLKAMDSIGQNGLCYLVSTNIVQTYSRVIVEIKSRAICSALYHEGTIVS